MSDEKALKRGESRQDDAASLLKAGAGKVRAEVDERAVIEDVFDIRIQAAAPFEQARAARQTGVDALARLALARLALARLALAPVPEP